MKIRSAAMHPMLWPGHLLAVLVLLFVALAPARAHQASDAYLNWRIDGERIEQRIDLSLRDLDRELVLDADDDGVLRWGEIRSREADIIRLVDAALQPRADGADCRLSARAPMQVERHADGQHLVLRSSWACAAPVQVAQLDYRLFARTDPSHRGLLNIAVAETAGQPASDGQAAVLIAGEGERSWVLAQAGGGFLDFVREGMHHIAIGLDHILFLVTLLLVAVWRREGDGWTPRETASAAWREALVLISTFTLAHSLTLGLVTVGVLPPPTRWVEALIAVSVLLAALDNLRPLLPGPRWPLVGLFGLIHGVGFAGPLQDLGLREDQLLLQLLGFNLGVELGQLALVALLLPLAIALRHAPAYRRLAVQGGSGAIALLALVWTAERGLDLSLLPQF